MSVTAAFPGMSPFRQQVIRAPVNPMDKCTVVSIFPFHIRETKPTISPSTFIIAPGSYENPTLLVVGPSSWWREIDEKQPMLEIPVSSIQVADAIVRDYCNGLLGCNMSDIMPGLFYLQGAVQQKNLKIDHLPELDVAASKQRRWFEKLIELADIDWAKTNGNPLCINSLMRHAAKELGLEATKDWMEDFKNLQMIRCIACGALRNPAFPVCGSCHAVIDKKRAEE